MSNIWEVLLQSCTVTFCAVVLIIVKNALRDKLSPRWQYGVWAVLALRIVWPASMSRTLMFNFPLWFEMLKTRFENGGSAYASKYVPLELHSGLPWPEGAPQSLADWIFIIYIIGIFAFLLRHAASYIKLRVLLKRGGEPTAELREAMERVCAQYALKPCRMVSVAELPSAFVCGVFRPVLAVPADSMVDDKVLLHELLHLKHRDILQNVFWCCLHALHWWNIFLWPVFERIGNELESLCDQRVLERLEGEQRREYGGILLEMASEKYARALGTSSISNGGTFISQRIENIARFKKYPRGMVLVSVCIALVLGLGLLGGNVRDYQGTDFSPSAYLTGSSNVERSMAITRLNRCRTPDAAIDAYAKAMLQRNGFYLATASPLSQQEAIMAEMEASEKPNHADRFIDNGAELEYVSYLGTGGYVVSEYSENPDGSVDAELQFSVSTLLDSEGNELQEEPDTKYYTQGGVVIMNVRAEKSPDGWIAYEVGERRGVLKSELMDYYMLYLEPSFSKTVETEHGSLTMHGLVCRSMAEFDGITFFASNDNGLHLGERFTESLVLMLVYDVWDRESSDWPGEYISTELVPLWREGDEAEFNYDKAAGSRGETKQRHYSYQSNPVSAKEWFKYNNIPEPREMPLDDAPWGYAVRVCWDGEIVEEAVFPLEEVLAGD